MERAIIDEFLDCTTECHTEVEACVRALNQHGGPEYIHRMFRSMHSLKGNCQMVGLTPFKDLMHRVEEIFAHLRAHPEQYFPELGEFLLMATDQIVDLLYELLKQGHADENRRALLATVCDNLRQQNQGALQAASFRDAIAMLGGKTKEKSPGGRGNRVNLQLQDDISLMRYWADKIDALTVFRKNRNTTSVELALELNTALGKPVDAQQLEVAVLMHDVGMAFVPHAIFNKETNLSREELRILQEHVQIGSQMLLRFGGWDDAAAMVLDHHEYYDGSGYPNRKKGEQIHAGARMLAVIDAFCSVTTERSDRSYKKSLLSAISEINANIHTQFDPHIVGAFNEVVRNMVLRSA
ncbi:hypothetical protein GCM10010946_32830 [Undibacterium squillarum]|uniref:HD domain-containing protein n=2 Tax=Undibacterium squillarum TaxID=1131567 RepID=A0ABQ2Y3G8_9BURK|nr:hypothetical protein GCM10010946_32830 [Undibacterium squillarum]